MTVVEAIRLLVSRVDGLPDHPWIPGVNFEDGKLMEAIHALEAFADEHS